MPLTPPIITPLNARATPTMAEHIKDQIYSLLLVRVICFMDFGATMRLRVFGNWFKHFLVGQAWVDGAEEKIAYNFLNPPGFVAPVLRRRGTIMIMVAVWSFTKV